MLFTFKLTQNESDDKGVPKKYTIEADTLEEAVSEFRDNNHGNGFLEVPYFEKTGENEAKICLTNSWDDMPVFYKITW